MARDLDSVQQQQHFHVLAVDDSLIDRKLLERLLRVSSYQVTCVDSGDKALQYLGLVDVEENGDCSTISESVVSEINLIITDYSMPGISGYDLLKRIKGSSWKHIPVVVMSSENEPSRVNMCLEGGAEEFLVKPVKLSDLRKLHSQLESSIKDNNNKYDSSQQRAMGTKRKLVSGSSSSDDVSGIRKSQRTIFDST